MDIGQITNQVPTAPGKGDYFFAVWACNRKRNNAKRNRGNVGNFPQLRIPDREKGAGQIEKRVRKRIKSKDKGG